MLAYIEVDTFIKGAAVFRGASVEVSGLDDPLLKELQVCGKISKTEPFKEINPVTETKSENKALPPIKK